VFRKVGVMRARKMGKVDLQSDEGGCLSKVFDGLKLVVKLYQVIVDVFRDIVQQWRIYSHGPVIVSLFEKTKSDLHNSEV